MTLVLRISSNLFLLQASFFFSPQRYPNILHISILTDVSQFVPTQWYITVFSFFTTMCQSLS